MVKAKYACSTFILRHYVHRVEVFITSPPKIQSSINTLHDFGCGVSFILGHTKFCRFLLPRGKGKFDLF